MTITSVGSRPDPKQFLDGKVEEILTELQRERIPSRFDQMAYGRVADDIATKAQNKQIVV